ncbi:unnamed protein product [Arctia plantaginis]|uniref:FP protein C-terminal domain-containing protein n=1 Tax=Arctia plantaginis TaxID=874455 RepID=A0A8S1AUV4_ARCPL|nr:unnamed protein product [Arctia plantaginis]
MPVDRTPPKQQITLPTRTVQRQRSDSEPNLNLNDMQCELENLNATVRAKRKRSEDSGDVNLSVFMSEMTKMFHDFKNEQELKVSAILASVTDIKKQNSDICASVEYVSKSYDALLEQINHLKSERQENLNYIRTLENRLEKAERNARSSCVEIRNIPPNKKESKEQLLHTIIATGRTLNIPIESYEVRDIFRIQTKEPDQKPIIVDFTSVIKKERFIHMYKQFTKNTRLTTEHLKISGTCKPIFISENLTPVMKRLFFLCRDFAKVHEYKYCWVSHGKIYLRKTEGAPSFLIKTETDLSNLKVPK